MAGSPGTKTQAFQFLKGSTVYLKDGTLESTPAKMMIQNYSDLTLDNVKITGGNNCLYVVSNNYGSATFKNGTELHAAEGRIAFDAYYGMSSVYDDGVTVTIEDDSVVIDGPIEYGKAARASEEAFLANTHIYKPTGYALDAPEGYQWVDAGDGKEELRPVG